MTHSKCKFDNEDPFIDLLYQSNRLYKDIAAQNKKILEQNMINKNNSKTNALNAMKKNRR